jgi:hypothetical protein
MATSVPVSAPNTERFGDKSPPVSTPTSPLASSDGLPRVVNILIDSVDRWQTFDVVVRQSHPDRAVMALDAEWHDELLCLVQIAVLDLTPPSRIGGSGAPNSKPKPQPPLYVFTIDCLAFAARDIAGRLAPILNDVRFRKLTFDCREDCRMLHRSLRLPTPVGIVDLQLMELLTRDEPPRAIYNVRGLKAMLLEFPSLCRFREAKAAQDLTAEGSSVVFTRRPITQAVLDYASCDVASLFTLYSELQMRPRYIARPGAINDEVLRGSRIYATINMFVPESFRRHNMLPLGVLSLAPPQGLRTCTGCNRDVAARDLDMCRVCSAHSRRHQQGTYFGATSATPPLDGANGSSRGVSPQYSEQQHQQQQKQHQQSVYHPRDGYIFDPPASWSIANVSTSSYPGGLNARWRPDAAADHRDGYPPQSSRQHVQPRQEAMLREDEYNPPARHHAHSQDAYHHSHQWHDFGPRHQTHLGGAVEYDDYDDFDCYGYDTHAYDTHAQSVHQRHVQLHQHHGDRYGSSYGYETAYGGHPHPHQPHHEQLSPTGYHLADDGFGMAAYIGAKEFVPLSHAQNYSGRD